MDGFGGVRKGIRGGFGGGKNHAAGGCCTGLEAVKGGVRGGLGGLVSSGSRTIVRHPVMLASITQRVAGESPRNWQRSLPRCKQLQLVRQQAAHRERERGYECFLMIVIKH